MIHPAPQRVRRSARILCAFACLSSLAGPAWAQRSADGETLLHDRKRAAMHPGDPLTIVGLEQGGSDLRSRTPVLAQSNRSIALVNTDENYRRTLAMYEEGATFHQPLPLLHPQASAFSDSTTGNPSALSRAKLPVPDSASSDWPWVLGLGLVGLLMVWFQRKSSRASVAPSMNGSRSV